MPNINAAVTAAAIAAAPAQVRSDFARSQAARDEKLRRCYAIPGFAELPPDKQKQIYDNISDAVNKEFFL
jgi:hypothetical protein